MTSPKPSLAVRLQRAITRLATLALLVAAGVIAAKYVFSERLDEGIRSRIEAELRRNYPALEVHVKAARRVQGKGIEIRGLVISQPAAQGGHMLLQVSEVLAECDTGFPDFVAQDPKFRRLQVRGMKVRAKRTANGTWNVAGLLPLPKQNGPSPPAEIKEGTLELVDEHDGGSGSLVLRDIELSVNPRPQSKRPGDALLGIQGSLGGDHLERIEIDALLDPVSGKWSLRGRVEGLEFNPRMRAALPSELSSILQPLASVRGRTQFGFHVTRGTSVKHAAGPPPVQFSIDGQIAEGRIDDSRLPEPLTDVTASIHCDNSIIRIDDLSARCGQTIVQNLSAELRGYSVNSPLSIRLNAKNIDLSRVPVASLPAAARDAWARFSPQGSIDLSGSITFDGREWRPALTAKCLNLSLLYRQFPYRVGQGIGTISYAKNHLSANLRLVGGGQKLLCTAEIDNPGPNYLGWLELKSAGPLLLEDGIIAAMEEKSQNIVRDFNPRGHISFAGRVERNLERGTNTPRAVEHRQLTVQLHDMTIQHEKFTYPIDKVTGKLEYNDGDWTFSNLAGRNDSASITGSGYWVAKAADGNQLSLTFRAHNVAFEE
ncbi:MAG: AsmA-like C-terminal region-containing protein, partial [Planctomycetales bacterium]|nr:AsmA-like C-terminal region-containing protein [Planctomycetales bacterium]